MAEESPQRKWLVRDPESRIKGPFTTPEIMKKIRSGEVSVDDEISLYPGGQWYAISQDPEFYDLLLDVLAQQDDDSYQHLDESDVENIEGDSKKEKEPEESTRQTFSEMVDDNIIERDYTKLNDKKPKTKSKPQEEPPSRRPSESQAFQHEHFEYQSKPIDEDIIEMVDVKKQKRKLKKKASRLPFLFLVTAVAIIAVVFILPPSKPQSRAINLTAPGPEKNSLSPDEIEKKLRRAFAFYTRDTFKNYLRAQNEYIQAFEGGSRNYRALAGLCLTYLELWPYTKQDSKNFNVVSQVTQKANSYDPAGVSGSTCKVVDMMIRGQNDQAAAVIERVLNTSSNSKEPPVAFYYFKAKQLEKAGKFREALGYATSAQQLWPAWIKVYVFEAELRTLLNEASEAGKRYQQVLKVNPQHKLSLVRLGVLEYKSFFRNEAAIEYFKRALSVDDRIPNADLSAAYLGLAEISVYSGDEQGALKYAQKAYALSSTNLAAKNLVVSLGGVEKLEKIPVKGQQLIIEGDQFVREGNCMAAKSHYQAAYKANKKNGVAAMKAAKCAWQLSFSKEAIEWLNKAVQADPKLVEAYTLLADYYAQSYNFMAAATVLAKAKTLAPQNSEVMRGYARVEFLRHNYSGAASFAKKALALYASDVQSLLILAESQIKLGELSDAFATATKAVEIEPTNPDAQILYANSLAGAQGAEVGIDYIVGLIQRFPVVHQYRMALGKAYFKDERYSQAEKVFRDLIKIETKPKEAYLYLGRTLAMLGHFEVALDAYLQAAILDPADAEPLFEAGLLYIQTNKPQKAQKQFMRVLKVNERYPLVHYYIGKTFLMMGKLEDAISESEKERRINPKLAESYVLAAEAYTKMRKFTLCASEYQKAIALKPHGAEIYVKLARCYRLSGNLDVANSMLNQAAKIESGLPAIYLEQGQVFEMQGNMSAAITAYKKYVILDPSSKDAAQVRSKIRAFEGQ